MSTEEYEILDPIIPQWKRDLILRRRAVGRVLPTGSGSVQLTCPSVVTAVRLAEYSVDSDFLRRCESERERTGSCKNMRLVEQVNASDDFVEPGITLGIKEIITKIESCSSKDLKMGEEKNCKKISNSSIICDKKSNDLIDIDNDDNASDSSEEFKYGPGIVSKLKSKYLSLTLRESQGRVRPSLDSLRRATSLENILDAPEGEKPGEHKSNYLKNIQPAVNGNVLQRCRGLSRSNRDSMKRARSVEVLTRYDRGNFNCRRSLDSSVKDVENDGEKKRKTRNRISSSSVEEKELPPPDLVKHTLKIFENSQNQKTTYNVIKKNQKNSSDFHCAKKPLISPKPSLVSMQNGGENSVKSNGEIVNGNKKEIHKKNKFNDKNVVKKFENLSENNCTDFEVPGTVERRKAALLKEIPNKSVINKVAFNENQSELIKASSEDEQETNGISSNSLKKELSLDLTDLATPHYVRQKTSPAVSASPKSNIESPEPQRCISPVLIRAPPSILSSELNSNNSPNQQMKQVGVIRPIVTNKLAQSNSPKQSANKSQLTEREIEKNLINRVKSIEQPVTKVIVSLKKSPEECYVNETAKTNESNVKKGQFWDKKPNTMVFNFSNRKTVPDYIENDGLILVSRKEKPKIGEPGFIFLGGGTDDSSTDFDPEEFTSDPVLPCDIIFEGDNILINGRSNIQSKPKSRKMKIQFNDEATTLFEYPSEASLLDDQENLKADTEVPAPDNGSSIGVSSPFRCSSLASYTPAKVSLPSDFQLGVTKTQSPPKPAPRLENGKEEKGGEGGGAGEGEGDGEEDYLRPAGDDSTLTWSSETAPDLLF